MSGVFVIPKEDLKDIIPIRSGYQPASLKTIVEIIDNPNNFIILNREDAETDESYLQIIPYIIVRDEHYQIFHYRRGSGGGEERLKKKLSIGIGGHIEKEDFIRFSPVQAYRTAFQRELQEEIGVEDVQRIDINGIVLDRETPVGRVHIGIVQTVWVNRESVQVAEEDIEHVGWATVPQLESRYDEFEDWSQHLIRQMYTDSFTYRQYS